MSFNLDVQTEAKQSETHERQADVKTGNQTASDRNGPRNTRSSLSPEETADLQRRASGLVTDIKRFLPHVVHDTSHSLEPSAIDILYEQWKQEFHSWVERGRRETLTRMTIKKVSTTDADSDERRVFSIWQLLVSFLGVKAN